MLVNIIYLLINIIIINIHEMSFVHWCRVSQYDFRFGVLSASVFPFVFVLGCDGKSGSVTQTNLAYTEMLNAVPTY
jgi:hypothetical protein